VLEDKEPGSYERLRRDAKLGLLTDNAKNAVAVSLDLSAPIGVNSKNYGWKFLDEVYKHFGLNKIISEYSKTKKYEYNLDSILKLLVFQRCLNPDSKSKNIEAQKEMYGTWNNKLHDCYRSLDDIAFLQEEIQSKIHKVVSKDTCRVSTLVFYDVTNYYFDTDFNDPDEVDENGKITYESLRKRGPSKEKKPKPIVQMGMFVDTNGIPISYKLFPGNNTDPITYIPAIEQVKKQFGIERVVTVADKAMNSVKNITATNDVGDGWIFSSKIRGSRGTPKDLQEFALSEDGWEYNYEGTFAKKSKIRKRKLSTGKTVSEKVVVTWSEKYDAREKQRRKGAVEYAAKLTNAELFRQTAKRGGKKYLELEYVDPETGDKKPFNPFISIDYKQVEEDSKFDGLNVLLTSELDMSDEEIISNYRQLHKIEDCFRVTKTDLSARPVYVWTDIHIQAHFMTCFISLTILRYIKYTLGKRFSEERIITALKSANCINYDNGYYRVEANEDLQEINRMIGIDFKKQNIEEEKVNIYSRKWCSTFLKHEKKS
jgi:transposase